jgi:hypothetical protein
LSSAKYGAGTSSAMDATISFCDGESRSVEAMIFK